MPTTTDDPTYIDLRDRPDVTSERVERRPARAVLAVMLLVGAGLVVAGGVVHLDQWLNEYRDVPTDTPGWAVVRIGFPADFALSVLAALGLLWAAVSSRVRAGSIIFLTIAFQAGALVGLVWNRHGSLFGWSEQGWDTAAKQAATFEALAIAVLLIAAVLYSSLRRTSVSAER